MRRFAVAGIAMSCVVLAIPIAAHAQSLTVGKVLQTPVPISGRTSTSINLGPTVTPVPCEVGNPTGIAFAVGGFMMPPEEYALLISPGEECPDCPAGIDLISIHIYLSTDSSCSIVLTPDVRNAVTVPGTPCLQPGEKLC